MDGPLGEGSRRLDLRAADGVMLRAAVTAAGARGLALVLQGRTEFCEKYAGVTQALSARGFAVAMVDWRGQGGSARALADPRKGHVEDFAAYQRDLAALVAELGPPRVVLAHSMGACIGLRALLDGALAPGATVFSAPMWGLAQSFVAAVAGRALAAAGCAVGLGDRYAPGGGPAAYAEGAPEPNVLTSDPEQAAWLGALTRAHPALALGGPTLGWLRAAYREMDALAARPLRAPALVAVGGEEAVVSPAAIRARAQRDGLTLAPVDGGRHELFIETPARRAALWRAIDAHLAQRGV